MYGSGENHTAYFYLKYAAPKPPPRRAQELRESRRLRGFGPLPESSSEVPTAATPCTPRPALSCRPLLSHSLLARHSLASPHRRPTATQRAAVHRSDTL